MNSKVVAVGLVISILVIAILVSGIIPGFHLPRKASLISVSNVNLQPGGQIQNSYVIHTYWDAVLTINSQQNVALAQVNFGPSNDSSLQGNQINGQTVKPTTQIYVTFNPLQPYITLSLLQRSTTFAPAATGFGNVTTPGCNNNFCTTAWNGEQISTQAQPLTYYTVNPNDAVWHYHYPVQITVQKAGGLNPFTITNVVDVEQTNSITIANPQNPSENLTINSLGNFKGSLSSPPINNPIFYQANGNWYGWNNGLQGISSYAQYWFGSSDNFGAANGEGISSPDQSYWPGSQTTYSYPNETSSCPNTVHPGWGQVEGYTALIHPASQAYFYYPIGPQIATDQQSYSKSQVAYSWSAGGAPNYDYTITQQCPGLSLNSWLGYAGYTQFQWNPYGLGNWGTVNSSMLVEDLPYSPSISGSVVIPTLQLLISSTLVNTIIYQINNATFSLSTPTLSSSSIQSGEPDTITTTVTNTGSVSGTPTIGASDSLGILDISPITTTGALNPGQSAKLEFTVSGLTVLTSTKDTINVWVSNDAGQITDSKSVSITVTPQPTAGQPDFVITNITAPSSLAAGSSHSVTITLENLGASGTAQLTVTSEEPLIADIVPTIYNQSIGSGTSVPISLTLTTGQLPKSSQTVTFDVAVTGGATSKFSVLITVGGGPPGATCPPSCGPGGIPILDYAIGGILIAAAVVIGVWYFRKNS